MARLIQAPNGDWVDPFKVTLVRSFALGSEFQVLVFVGEDHTCGKRYDTRQEADLVRDAFANPVNLAYEEDHKLRESELHATTRANYLASVKKDL